MPVRCLTSSRFTMNAEILNWKGITTGDDNDVTQGDWETYQDPITGAILNEWIPRDKVGNFVPVGDPTASTISCLVRGIVDGGIRVAGTTERFGDSYENIDYAKMWVPASVRITKRDRITNVRSKKGGRVIWLDEEFEDGTRPTVFNVNGVTPLFDAFNKHVESFVLLEKADA